MYDGGTGAQHQTKTQTTSFPNTVVTNKHATNNSINRGAYLGGDTQQQTASVARLYGHLIFYLYFFFRENAPDFREKEGFFSISNFIEDGPKMLEKCR